MPCLLLLVFHRDNWNPLLASRHDHDYGNRSERARGGEWIHAVTCAWKGWCLSINLRHWGRASVVPLEHRLRVGDDGIADHWSDDIRFATQFAQGIKVDFLCDAVEAVATFRLLEKFG